MSAFSQAPPPQRTPQAILLALDEGQWEDLRAMDQVASVLLDLWNPEHLNRGGSLEAARIRRLNAGAELIRKGFRLGDARASALSMLLDWYVPEPTSQDLSPEEVAAWVQTFEALHHAGQSLEAPVIEDFDEWMGRDAWGWLASSGMFEPVARGLQKKGILRIYIPARPNLKHWPQDPTFAVLDESGFVNPSRYWATAIRQGYPLAGRVGPQFIFRAAEWDMTGEAVRAALETGQVDVHFPVRGRETLLGAILESRDSAFISLPALSLLLEHDALVLDAVDSQGRALHAVMLEFLADLPTHPTGALSLPFNREAVEKIGRITRAHRLSLRMEKELPLAPGCQDSLGTPIGEGRL